jgi:hypothetical protein
LSNAQARAKLLIEKGMPRRDGGSGPCGGEKIMSTFPGSGYGILEQRFIAEPASRATAGAFGRRTYGRPAPAPTAELEVERVLARCRARRVTSAAPEEKARPRLSEDMLAYVATSLSLLALAIVSVLPVF